MRKQWPAAGSSVDTQGAKEAANVCETPYVAFRDLSNAVLQPLADELYDGDTTALSVFDPFVAEGRALLSLHALGFTSAFQHPS